MNRKSISTVMERTTNTGEIPDPKNESQSKGRRKMSDMSQGPGLLEMVAGDEPEEDEQEKLGARSSSVIKFYPDWCRCCHRASTPVANDAPLKDKLHNFFQCPPSGTLNRLILCLLLILCLWGVLYFLFLPLSEQHKNNNTNTTHETDVLKNPAWVQGPLFALGIIEITGLISGILLKRFLNLPPLLGPLILGIIYHNVAPIDVFHLMKGFDVRDCKDADRYCQAMATQSVNNWVKPIRIIALGIILTRAGLELSPKQLSKLKGVVPLLAFSPCVVEAIACAISSFIFFNVLEKDKPMKMAMCFVGGFALAAVSPAVVVPGALSLKKSGYGVVKGIPTLLIAASSIDDVLAISIYTIALGFAIEKDENAAGGGEEGKEEDWHKYTAGIIGIAVGIVHGVILGMVLHFLPSRTSKYKAENRLLLLLLINFFSILAYEETFFNGAGSISVLMTSLIAGFGWRSQPHWKLPMKKIETTLAHMWVLWVPLIFGTIGKEIDFTTESFKYPTILKIFGVIGISLTFRCTTAFLAAGCGTGYNYRERLFIALSWIPKATVQAALAPLVLTRAADAKQDIQKNAEIVVNIAILAVLLTAPIGCVLIALTGPKLLEHNSSPEIKMQVEAEFPNGEGVDPEESTSLFTEADSKRTTTTSIVVHDIKPHMDSSNELSARESEVPPSQPVKNERNARRQTSALEDVAKSITPSKKVAIKP